MTNNDIIRRIRYTFNFDDAKMLAIFKLADYDVAPEKITAWLKKEDDITYLNIPDKQLAVFLNGLINEKRGRKEGEQPVTEKQLTNNIILRKLKIALNLKDHEMLAILDSVNMRISKHELSAFFRKPTQSQYRLCHNQILRNFLHGMQLKYRDSKS